MLASRKLPHQLKLLLSNPNILKVGRMVNADLKYLQTASGSSVPFVGSVDLAKFAKDRLFISNARCSLADLTAAVLQKRLSKSNNMRLSTAWEDENLSSEMLKYAALDAYTSLLIYETARKVDPPQPLPTTITPSMHIIIYNDDFSRVIASGRISQHFKNDAFDSIQITAKRTVIEVEKVLVPGAIISTHKKQALETFGPPPFHIVCLKSHLRLHNLKPSALPQMDAHPIHHASASNILPTLGIGPLPNLAEDPSSSSSALLGESIVGGNQSNETSTLDFRNIGNTDPEPTNEAPSIGSLVFDQVEAPEDEAQLNEVSKVASSEVDQESVLEGEAILGPTPNQWSVIRSRVLNDAYHIFGRFYISAAHGLRVEFCRALRDAIFIPDDEDKRRITAWGATQTCANIHQPHPGTSCLGVEALQTSNSTC
jgi:hypothetical protein